MTRAAIATLSTENLLHNLSVIKQRASKSKIIAMVKANGYGHGLRSVSQRLERHVYSFGVASIDEALALRNAGIKIPITLMEGVFEPDELLIASCQNFHVVIHDETQLNWLLNTKLHAKLNVWLKVDTGMGRLGLEISKVDEIHNMLKNCKKVHLPIGLMSHLACADEVEHTLNRVQIERFKQLTPFFEGLKSLANSAAIFSFNESHFDVIRPGLAIFGISPFKNVTAAELNLKSVMNLQTRLIAVKKIAKGSTIGYGAHFECPEDMTIGVVAMGYGDGYPRTACNGTPVIVNDVRCQLVGRVSMDMMTIDLRNNLSAKIGDLVTLWGNDLPLEEVAKHTSNITYDIICAIQNRVKFHWTMNI